MSAWHRPDDRLKVRVNMARFLFLPSLHAQRSLRPSEFLPETLALVKHSRARLEMKSHTMARTI